MGRIQSKSQLEALADWELDLIAHSIGIGMVWPPPFHPKVFELRETLDGTPFYIPYFCTNMTNATTLANAVGLTVDPSWTARQVVIESIWHFDQGAGQ